MLLNASDNRHLRSAPHEILKILKLESRGNEAVIVCGETFDKGQDGSFLYRRDGSRISFGVTLRKASPLELVAYRFHIRFPDGRIPPFLRFDLNSADSGDPLSEPRCHVHPGTDELRLPSPVMAPLEILAKIVYNL